MPYTDTLKMIAHCILFALCFTAVSAQSASDLVGTWSTKSRGVITGPGFYNPVNDSFFEPKHTGFSYSFTSDGHFEEAYYRALANPTSPDCPRGIIQWQHGTYSVNSDGTLTLKPIAVDGRQLLSDPCGNQDEATYTRYNQTESFMSFDVYKDPYHGVQRLDLKSVDGSPLHPMYLVYNPPQMLPTSTLNPVVTETAKAKRSFIHGVEPPKDANTFGTLENIMDPDRFWWIGLVVTSVGALGLLLF
ncbi:Reversal of tor2 lethality [Monascus purpureus]|uniref:Protein ROT1 n=1 Tax=Monascus purpureus TaxID=5098 RepID=A0A507R0W2_MONPU|nr:Reversal of tor2 lethality [Monascus purpureus]BDD56192.1 hypothetical protein MAP00_001667 [Monascus purpureus]